MSDGSETEGYLEIDHTYANFNTSPSNRYLKSEDEWGGFYVGYEGYPLELAAYSYEQARARDPSVEKYKKHSYFHQLRKIYRMSCAAVHRKVRLAVWNRTELALEIWEPTGGLEPFPRRFVSMLFDKCRTEAELGRSREWLEYLRSPERNIGPNDPGIWGQISHVNISI